VENAFERIIKIVDGLVHIKRVSSYHGERPQSTGALGIGMELAELVKVGGVVDGLTAIKEVCD